MGKLASYGGQAVIEGVMMRGAHRVAVAVRNPQGKIVVYEERLNPFPLAGLVGHMPFLRGLALMWDSLGIGFRALMWSANVALGNEAPPQDDGSSFTGMAANGFSMALVFMTPVLLSGGIARFFRLKNNFAVNMLESLVRLALVTGYIYAVGQIEQGKRLFSYHGAEHKTINAYEAGAPLTPESVTRFPLEHPRCGTAFLLTVMLISLLLHSVIGRPKFKWLVISRLLLLPITAGLAYEFIKFTAANMNNPTVRVLVAPNLLMQRLTTREPDLKMIEVAICALERVLAAEEAVERERV